MKLLLFDIDMTLINTAGAGKTAMETTFVRLFSATNGLNQISFAGRTDRAILRDALAVNDLAWSTEREDAFKRMYFDLLQAELSQPGKNARVLPGIAEILDELRSESRVVLALLTGNWQEGARIKLGHFGLYDYFRFGAFADDSEFRNDLPAVAAQRYREQTGKSVAQEDIYVIGDTPLDVACAKSYGAQSIAVATGFFSPDELRESQPDYLFDDLSDRKRFMDIILGG